MCGEHAEDSARVELIWGSSPHVRGAPDCQLDEAWRRRDHPRMCGEHEVVRYQTLTVSGSSPHVRGARGNKETTERLFGIIPACAGSTPSRRLRPPRTRDHPRMCGEHRQSEPALPGWIGSSPHVRGAQLRNSLRCLIVGIIPACAGSTRRFVLSLSLSRDHPRMCGEHARTSGAKPETRGSSPHVRGARRRQRPG